MNTSIYKTGFWFSLLAFIAMATYTIVQLMQILRWIQFPFDEILIYGSSLCIVVPYLLAILALHYTVSKEKKYWTHSAVLLSVIYAVFVTANYVVQLATVLPQKINGTLASVSVLDQTPHSMFWNFDAIGYICMGLASLALVPAFAKQGFEKWVRLSMLVHACVTPLIAIVYFYPHYSEKLLLLGFPWGITAPLSMLMLALYFRKQIKEAKFIQGIINFTTTKNVLQQQFRIKDN